MAILNVSVIVWEGGRWDVKKYVTNPETRDNFYKYMEQFWFRVYHIKSPFEDADEGVSLVMDLGGFEASQLTSVESEFSKIFVFGGEYLHVYRETVGNEST